MRVQRCPYCGSENTLPFEDEAGHDHEISIHIIIGLGLFLIGIYFAVIITSYLYYPLIVFAGIIIASKFINKNHSDKKKKITKGEDALYICLNCNRSFNSNNLH